MFICELVLTCHKFGRKLALVVCILLLCSPQKEDSSFMKQYEALGSMHYPKQALFDTPFHILDDKCGRETIVRNDQSRSINAQGRDIHETNQAVSNVRGDVCRRGKHKR